MNHKPCTERRQKNNPTQGIVYFAQSRNVKKNDQTNTRQLYFEWRQDKEETIIDEGRSNLNEFIFF